MASLVERIKEYSKTSTGKIVVVAVPTAALVLIVAVVFLVVLKGGDPAGEQAAGQGAEATTTGTSETPAAADPTAATSTPSEPVGEPPANLDLEVYETRDPFKPADSTASSSITTTNTATGAAPSTAAGTQTVSNAAQSQTLTLKSVSEENGVLYANIDYSEASYMVRAGERVGQSPYQVTAVSTEGSTLLFGDDSVTLDVGDQVTK